MVSTDYNAHSAPPSRKTSPAAVTVATTTVAITFVILLGYLSMGGETYCVLWPSVDTRFASGYSENKFAQIQPGMTEQQVLALIGAPLGKQSRRGSTPTHANFRSGDEVWTYSTDGGCPWGADFAWLAREVMFRNSRVVMTARWIYRD